MTSYASLALDSAGLTEAYTSERNVQGRSLGRHHLSEGESDTTAVSIKRPVFIINLSASYISLRAARHFGKGWPWIAYEYDPMIAPKYRPLSV